ncbi:AcrR family transcriptional regulator [Paraburkholderia sp. WC7.3g]|uniref:TetR/AcrR family transcriptional regulator n=1 Tax=Paraburkholderia sp. WC7.3g TaxID=2991070 RepID=UPI003D1A1DE4
MKQGRQELIAQAALTLFQQQGFTGTKMAQIASAAAGMTAANLYLYFDSKLAILYEVYRPWLRAQLATLSVQVRAQDGAEQRLRRLLVGLWRDIPGADANFANALIDALAQRHGRAEPSSEFLNEVEVTVGTMLRECLDAAAAARGGSRIDDAMLSRLIWMAFDGFVINRRLGDVRDAEAVASLIAAPVLEAPATSRAPRPGAGVAA